MKKLIIIIISFLFLTACSRKSSDAKSTPDADKPIIYKLDEIKHPFNSAEQALTEFLEVYDKSLLLLDDNDDKQKLKKIKNKITELLKTDYEENLKNKNRKYGNDEKYFSMSYRPHSHNKSSFGEKIRANFTFEDSESLVFFYLVENPGFNFMIEITGGGDIKKFTKSEIYQVDFPPNRLYKINTLADTISYGDFYWG